MGKVKVLARDWKLEINLAGFKEVNGLENFSFGSEKHDAETTTFDSEGWDEHLVAGRGRTLTAEGKYLEDLSNGLRDPGQQAVEDAADLMGGDSLVEFRLTSPAGNIKSFNASVDLSDMGGENNEATDWGFELLVSGKVFKEITDGLTELTGIEENGPDDSLIFVPSFDQNVLAYSVSVDTSSTYIKLTPTASDGVITVNGAEIQSGSETSEIKINAGLNNVYITVKEETKAPKTYTLTVARPS